MPCRDGANGPSRPVRDRPGYRSVDSHPKGNSDPAAGPLPGSLPIARPYSGSGYCRAALALARSGMKSMTRWSIACWGTRRAVESDIARSGLRRGRDDQAGERVVSSPAAPVFGQCRGHSAPGATVQTSALAPDQSCLHGPSPLGSERQSTVIQGWSVEPSMRSRVSIIDSAKSVYTRNSRSETDCIKIT